MSFEVGKSYNFTTIAPITLGANYNNVKVDAIFSFNIAKTLADVITINEKVKAEAKITTLDPMQTQYVLVITQDGDKAVLAIDWIVPESITEVSSVTANIIVNGVTLEDITTIRNVLTALGYKIDISVGS